MIRVHYSGNRANVTDAVTVANAILADPQFYDAILLHQSFTLTNATPAEVAEVLRNCDSALEVRLYKPANPFSRAYGKELPSFPDLVFLNTRKLNRSTPSIVGTIVHEAVHAADAVSDVDFSHGDNSPRGKQNTAPYWIGNLAVAMAKGGASPNLNVIAVAHAPHDSEELEGIEEPA